MFRPSTTSTLLYSSEIAVASNRPTVGFPAILAVGHGTASTASSLANVVLASSGQANLQALAGAFNIFIVSQSQEMGRPGWWWTMPSQRFTGLSLSGCEPEPMQP